MITMGITAAGAALVIHGGQAAICALIVIFGIIVKYEGRK